MNVGETQIAAVIPNLILVGWNRASLGVTRDNSQT